MIGRDIVQIKTQDDVMRTLTAYVMLLVWPRISSLWVPSRTTSIHTLVKGVILIHKGSKMVMKTIKSKQHHIMQGSSNVDRVQTVYKAFT